MNLQRITNQLHPMYNEALELYKISFPLHEHVSGKIKIPT